VIFVKVAQFEGFSRAFRSLGMPSNSMLLLVSSQLLHPVNEPSRYWEWPFVGIPGAAALAIQKSAAQTLL